MRGEELRIVPMSIIHIYITSLRVSILLEILNHIATSTASTDFISGHRRGYHVKRIHNVGAFASSNIHLSAPLLFWASAHPSLCITTPQRVGSVPLTVKMSVLELVIVTAPLNKLCRDTAAKSFTLHWLPRVSPLPSALLLQIV